MNLSISPRGERLSSALASHPLRGRAGACSHLPPRPINVAKRDTHRERPSSGAGTVTGPFRTGERRQAGMARTFSSGHELASEASRGRAVAVGSVLGTGTDTGDRCSRGSVPGDPPYASRPLRRHLLRMPKSDLARAKEHAPPGKRPHEEVSALDRRARWTQQARTDSGHRHTYRT